MIIVSIPEKDVVLSVITTGLDKEYLAYKALHILRQMPLVAMDSSMDCLQQIEFDRVEVTNLSPDGEVNEITVSTKLCALTAPDGSGKIPQRWYLSTTWTGAPVHFSSCGSDSKNRIVRMSTFFERVVINFEVTLSD